MPIVIGERAVKNEGTSLLRRRRCRHVWPAALIDCDHADLFHDGLLEGFEMAHFDAFRPSGAIHPIKGGAYGAIAQRRRSRP